MLQKYLIIFVICAGVTQAPAALAQGPVPPAPPAVKEQPWGKLVAADGKAEYLLDKEVTVVGSAPPSDIVIHDATVGKTHCKFTFKNGVAEIEDLGSKYGTLLAGRVLKKGQKGHLNFKTAITLGSVTLTFDWGTRPMVLRPTQPPSKPPKGWNKAKEQDKQDQHENKK